MNSEKLPRGLNLFCNKHGGRLRYHKGSYICIDKFDGSYCADVYLQKSDNVK